MNMQKSQKTLISITSQVNTLAEGKLVLRIRVQRAKLIQF